MIKLDSGAQQSEACPIARRILLRGEGTQTMPRNIATLRNQEAALQEFLAKKGEIDTMLARLQALSDDHFHAAPGEVNWGHVGTLERHVELLRQITDSAFKEGEYAD